ncbi:MAG: nucleotide exchange factor GrpE [Deltaproteobacteria bacterium]|nr:nucleotide exchange factor GrpE [Deltaproteobacteria bacterium]
MSSKNKNSDKARSTKSRADMLIEEAVKAVEAEESGDDSSEEVVSKETGSVNPVAKIDLQQYIEKEAYLRLAADFENFRRRAVKERQDSERNGREKILRGFLEIFDNLERGLSQSKNEDSALAEGIRMIISQAEIWMRSEGLERVETKGKLFDPTIHEAVSQIEDNTKPSGSILEEVKRGYKWSDRLLRPAAVIVSKNSEIELEKEKES